MNSLKKRLKKLEEALTAGKLQWKTNNGERVECFPEQLFAAKKGDPLFEQILNANLDTFEGPGSLLSLVRNFFESEIAYAGNKEAP